MRAVGGEVCKTARTMTVCSIIIGRRVGTA